MPRLGIAALILCTTLAAAAVAGVAPAPALRRPDVSVWPTLGTTVRTDPARPTIPAQFRQVLIEPSDYQKFSTTGRFSDGTRFAVLFHAAALDTSHSPPLYHAGKEVAFAMEVIDRRHPDGRRFYTFAPGIASASPLPPGNECAVCHRDRGSFDGTFAHLYPLIAARAGTQSKTSTPS